MTAFDPDRNIRWLFCMTHPDDEISICVWIRRLVTIGAPVYICWTHTTPKRTQEALKAAKRLGIPEERLAFFHAPDGDVIDHLEELRPQFEAWIARCKPDRICCGAFEQGHLDHDATNLLVHAAFKGPVFEIPFYHTYLRKAQRINRFSDHAGEEVLNLIPTEQEFKKRFAKGYPSQNIWSLLVWYEAWQLSTMKGARLRQTERMRLQTHADFLTPNHPETIRKKVEKCNRWKRWLQTVAPFVDDHIGSSKVSLL